jgi:ABC-type polysaccharide/polyol phosphate export permease
MLPENVKELVLLNPMAQLMEMAHNVTLYGTLPSYQDFLYTLGVISLIFLVGYVIFRKMEKRIVEEF